MYDFKDIRVVGKTRFELATARPPAEYSTRLSYFPSRISALYAGIPDGAITGIENSEQLK